jgi:hypothetical protein
MPAFALSGSWFRPRLEPLEDRAVPAVFLVTNTADGGFGSLRQAILNANNNGNAIFGEVDTIRFDISPGGPQRIDIVSQQFTATQLTLTEPVVIDGTTQPGITPGTAGIELNGRLAGSNVSGLVIASPGCTVRGLRINGFAGHGIWIRGASASGNVVEGNLIGAGGSITNGNGLDGVFVDNAPGNRIGGTTAAARNVISNNGGWGVDLVETGSAQASFPVGVFGNSRGEDPAGALRISGNFAVFDRLSGPSSPGDVFGTGLPGFDSLAILGTGSAPFDTSARYLYLYQEVNSPTSLIAGTVTGYGDGTPRFSSVTSFAQWSLFLRDDRGILSVANDFGHDGAPFTPSAAANVGVTNPGVASGPSSSSLVALNLSLTPTAFVADPIGGTFPIGSIDRLHGFTTNLPPSLFTDPISPGAATWTYPLPAPGLAGNVVQGNVIGTSSDFMPDNGNRFGGVIINRAPNNVIGGTTSGARNVISGNDGVGVAIVGGGADGNLVLGNFIGTNATGSVDLGNASEGIYIGEGSGFNPPIPGTAANNVIGGTTAGAANIIAFNAQAGVIVTATGTTGNRVRGNSIFSNGALGLDLSAVPFPADGVTLNDLGDADAGPNNFQNYPVLTEARAGASTRVAGSLNSTATTTFTLDFYANATADPSGYGEGQRYLGSISVTTDAAGNVSFDTPLPAATSPGEFITATATDPAGNTSEFSAVRLAAPLSLIVQELRINDGSAQRSNVETVAIQFNQDVNLQALINGGTIGNAVQLFTGTTKISLAANRYQYNAATFTLTIDLTVDGFGGSRSTMLADGRYELRLDTTLIAAAGQPGNPLVDDDGTADGVRRVNFLRLLGDFDGDGVVTLADRSLLLAHYGSVAGQPLYDFAFDLNGDGIINITDYLFWTTLLGHKV